MVAFHRKDIPNEGFKSKATNSNASRGQRGHQADGREAGGNCRKEKSSALEQAVATQALVPFCHIGRRAWNDVIFCVLFKREI